MGQVRLKTVSGGKLNVVENEMGFLEENDYNVKFGRLKTILN